MRLLKQEKDGKFSQENFVGSHIPGYAILSHTWGSDNDEVTFRDILDGTGKGKVGFDKILFCAKQAAVDGLQYFWVDTCCINKDSESELSEAIRCMFRWYQEASTCYVYLNDVPGMSTNIDVREAAFRKSRWFTRGWTLQELLAPRNVEFFSCEKEKLGDKASLEQHIYQVTRIPVEALQGRALSEFTIQERHSWAERRETTRVEDKAYSLFGIFGIHIPPLYGEGASRAWERLEDEIERGERKRVGREARKSKFGLSVSGLRSKIFMIISLLIPVTLWIGQTLLMDKTHETPRTVSVQPRSGLDPTLPIFAIIGKTGVGKSTFIDVLGGREAYGKAPDICHGLDSCTTDVMFYKFDMLNHEQAYIIDTPGFDDTNNMSDAEIMATLFNQLNELSLDDRLIKGLIYLYDISQPRVGRLEREHFQGFEQLCGKYNYKSVALVTTRWLRNPSEEESERQLQRETELKTKYWVTMLDIGSRIEQHDGSKESAMLIIANLLYKPTNRLKHPPGWIDKRFGRRSSFQRDLVAREYSSTGKKQGAPTTFQDSENTKGTSTNTSIYPKALLRFGSRCMDALTWLIRRISSDTSPPSDIIWTVSSAIAALMMTFWLNLFAISLVCAHVFHEVIIPLPWSFLSIIPVAVCWDWALMYRSPDMAYLAIFLYDLWLFDQSRDRRHSYVPKSSFVLGFPTVFCGVLSIWAVSSLASHIFGLVPLRLYIIE